MNTPRLWKGQQRLCQVLQIGKHIYIIAQRQLHCAQPQALCTEQRLLQHAATAPGNVIELGVIIAQQTRLGPAQAN